MKQYVILALLAIWMVSAPIAATEESDENEQLDAKKSAPDIALIDSDNDGVLSKQEFDSYRSSQDEENETNGLSAFASFDKDRDGVVTQEELNAHAKYSNPGNGTGELKANKPSRSSSSGNKSQGKGNNGQRGGGNGNKGGKNK